MDNKVLEKLIKSNFDDYIKSNDFKEKQKETFSKLIKSKDFENEIVDIVKNVLTQMHKTLWLKRNFWKDELKNKNS